MDEELKGKFERLEEIVAQLDDWEARLERLETCRDLALIAVIKATRDLGDALREILDRETDAT